MLSKKCTTPVSATDNGVGCLRGRSTGEISVVPSSSSYCKPKTALKKLSLE